MTEPNFATLSDPNIENAVLAAATVNDGHAKAAALTVTPSHFTSERRRMHWSCIAACVADAIPVNRVSVFAKAQALNVTDLVSLGYLCDADDGIPAVVTGFDGWLRLLDEKLIRRQIVQRAQSVQNRACDASQPVGDVLKRAGSLASDLGSKAHAGAAFAKVGDVVLDAGGVDAFFAPVDESQTLNVGIPAVDTLFPGARPGQLILVGGRTSQGKSAFLLQWAWHVAKRDLPVWYFSIEMPKPLLVQRIAALVGGVNLGDIVSGRMSVADGRRAVAALTEADASGLRIAYSPAVTASAIGAHLARAKERPALVVVDYLQLIRSSSRGSRYEQISEISRDLKTLAVEHNVPIVAGSQLSRPERGGEDRPRLSDLRDSGALEQDGDVVLFIHGKEVDRFRSARPVEILIAKQRQGRLGRADLVFDGGHQRFLDPTEEGANYAA